MVRAIDPYTPGAAERPQALIGRTEQQGLFDALLTGLESQRSMRSMLVVGLRGVGKTALLRDCVEQARARNWVIIDIEVSKREDDAFRRQLTFELRGALLGLSPRSRWGAAATRAAAVLQSFGLGADGSMMAKWEVAAADGIADSGDLAADLTQVVLAMGEAALENSRGVVIAVDEFQLLSQTQYAALVSAFHRPFLRELPITLVGAGLPRAGLTPEIERYAKRIFEFPVLGALTDADARRVLSEPAAALGVEFEKAALDAAVELTGRYPYFLQELGSAVWSAKVGSAISAQDVAAASAQYYQTLDDTFFARKFGPTTDLDRSYLRAMAEAGPDPQHESDLARMLDRTVTQCSQTRRSLLDRGLLHEFDSGGVAFTAPHFDRFIKRVMPSLTVPARAARRRRFDP
ncbi:ATP-binding protein [Rhodococcus sp. H29-C3]|uniref:AAA family ATPase n=1 Tax=Rhodococcus sp. H29-C3 TaxID=3046307 RepID=UPI0024BA5E00|nr:ATP-binding protein [Rhodococcus sp. H29-C3]MDJ0358970.1 ATP-binding protein [Rhodococcus sp. H29-C3]